MSVILSRSQVKSSRSILLSAVFSLLYTLLHFFTCYIILVSLLNTFWQNWQLYIFSFFTRYMYRFRHTHTIHPGNLDNIHFVHFLIKLWKPNLTIITNLKIYLWKKRRKKMHSILFPPQWRNKGNGHFKILKTCYFIWLCVLFWWSQNYIISCCTP